ncbi:DRTGG domain-containing protein [Pseudolactococcus plantarum]|uniref:DRTGG domain-containing protein n=1 Tax=Pseudolactococcus plantarum TaxID=1365 RepID=UPI00083101B9|nr:DRTGG domain-containing protein [Lactococcus plantarum]HCN47894.1 CBS domain-containing protein [Chryseobacterium sp.]
MSKHQELLDYIDDLEIGKKVSVRGLANRLSVSDGTAYRAIKEAQSRGLVSINDRSGTTRIANQAQRVIETLTFGEISKIASAEVMAGEAGLSQVFSKFAIGAMTKQNIRKYLTHGGLLIVGDRTDIQLLALDEENAVLITGGVDIEPEVLARANAQGIPVLRTDFDTFTVASRINRALSNELIKKEITTVADVYQSKAATLLETSTVKDYLDLVKKTNQSRFTVLNKANYVVGVVSMRDVTGKKNSTTIDKVMTSHPRLAKFDMTVASTSQKMIFDGYDMMPVINADNTFAGIISKSDMLRSMQESSEQSQFSHTLSDEVINAVKEVQSYYAFVVEPFMMNNVGNIANGMLVEIISYIAARVMTKTKRKNIIIESMTLYFLGAVSIDDELEVFPKIISETRLGATIDFEIYLDYQIISKILVTVQIN